jgi:hypothetical protein
VFVLPLLADYGEGKKKGWLWGLTCLALLAMSAAEYHGFETEHVDERYAEWSWSALVGFAVILGAFAREALRTRPDAVAEERTSETHAEPTPETS